MEVHSSAFKHGLTVEDVNHACNFALVAIGLEPDADPPKVLFIGPDSAGNLTEVIAIELADDQLMAIHAMALRPTFHKLLEEGERQ